MRKILFTFVISLLAFNAKPQAICTSTFAPSYIFFAGTPYNTATMSFTASGLQVLYLCNNALVYDTTSICDPAVMINPGAHYVWRPCGAATALIWIKSGGILTLKKPGNSGKTIYLEPGAIINDPFGLMAMYTVTYSCPSITFPTVSCTSGIPEIGNSNFVDVIPNPTSALLNLKILNNNQISDIEIKIKSFLGQEIKTIKPADVQQTLDISSLKNGIYFLELYSEDKLITTKKIIKQ